MRTRRYQLIAVVGLPVSALFVWLLVAGGATLVDALTAVFTAVAGVFTAVAAFAAAAAAVASRDAARDSRRALSMHYRPSVVLMAGPRAGQPNPPKAGDPAPILAQVHRTSLIDSITVHWTRIDGTTGDTILRPGEETIVPGLELLRDFPAWSVTWAQATVVCKDIRDPGPRWVAHIDRGTYYEGLIFPLDLHFEQPD